MTKTDHVQRIDVLRGFAILAVFCFHFLIVAFQNAGFQWQGLWLDIFHPTHQAYYVFLPFTFGWIGVSLFFVISGFCIHLSFLKATDFSAGAFYWRRFWRIYPPYLAALVGIALLEWMRLDIKSQTGQFQLFSHILLIHNFFSDPYFHGINPSFWSLAAEIQFYLIYPLLLIIRSKWGIEKALALTIFVSLACRFTGIFLQDWQRDFDSAIWQSPGVLWMDWTLGAYLAEKWLKGERIYRGFWGSRGFILGLILLFMLTTFWKPGVIYSFSFASIICSILIDRRLHSSRPVSAPEKLLIPLGLCSYSFYLWHQPLLDRLLNWLWALGMPNHFAWNMSLGFLVSFGVIFLGSRALYQWVELPSMDLGKAILRNWRLRKPLAKEPADLAPVSASEN